MFVWMLVIFCGCVVCVVRVCLCVCVFRVFISEVFLAGDIGQCRSHPREAFFPGESGGMAAAGEQQGEGGDGYYPCCKKPAYRCE